MDVSTSFLNGEIKGKVSINLPKNLYKYLQKIINDENIREDKLLYTKAKMTIDELRKSKNNKVCLLK